MSTSKTFVLGSSSYIKSKFILDSGILTIDNGTYTVTSPQAGNIFNTTHNIRLFSREGLPTTASLAGVTMYSIKIYNSGSLVFDGIPCINPSGGVGMYDTVTRKFFGNQGTGNFIPGPLIS